MSEKSKKLIKLLHGAKSYAANTMLHSDIDDVIDTSYDELQAEYLLKNGVVVPPCKPGDTVYVVYGDEIYRANWLVEKVYADRLTLVHRHTGHERDILFGR